MPRLKVVFGWVHRGALWLNEVIGWLSEVVGMWLNRGGLVVE